MLDAAAVIHRCAYERQCVIEFLPECSGSLGGSQLGPVPLEQRNSDLGLEGPYSLAYSGRRDAQFGSSPRKIAMPHTGSQDAQRFQRRQGFTHALFEREVQKKVKNYRLSVLAGPSVR
jgi:hypothetical protein